MQLRVLIGIVRELSSYNTLRIVSLLQMRMIVNLKMKYDIS